MKREEKKIPQSSICAMEIAFLPPVARRYLPHDNRNNNNNTVNSIRAAIIIHKSSPSGIFGRVCVRFSGFLIFSCNDRKLHIYIYLLYFMSLCAVYEFACLHVLCCGPTALEYYRINSLLSKLLRLCLLA